MSALHDSISRTENHDISKVRLLNALAELLEEHPMRSISVQSICERAGVSRQTFYRHFENKFAIAQWYWLQLASEATLQVGRTLTWHESLARITPAQEEIAWFLAETSREGDYESSREFGMRTRIQTLRETVVDYVGAPLTPLLEFQIRFFAIGEANIFEVVFSKYDEFSSENGETLSEALETCVPRELHDLLDGHVLRLREAHPEPGEGAAAGI